MDVVEVERAGGPDSCMLAASHLDWPRDHGKRMEPRPTSKTPVSGTGEDDAEAILHRPDVVVE
jgi:hypothetical protein